MPGKRVLITGANGLLGKAVADALHDRGDSVMGLDLNDGPNVLAADLRDMASTTAGVREAVKRLGGLDVLVNNAGLGGSTDPAQPPDDRALATIDVNLLGTWRATAAALPALLESAGRVVNVSSGLAFVALPHTAAYSVTKRGLVAYSDVLRAQLGDRLEVVTIFPGYIKGPIHEDVEAEGRSLEGLIREESLEDAVQAFVSAIHGPARRMRATTRRGRVELALAHKFPGIVNAMIARRIRGLRTRDSDGRPVA
ncbi:MAG: SDR family oxidoreductase [Actinobacteria bacterium]|nr:SDR family oxidoreductase [Actinomycetota bacterium]